MLDRINLFITKYNSCVNYFSIQIISKSSLLLNISKFNLKFNFVIVEAIDLFVFINKNIKFVNNILIKKKILDKSILDIFKTKKLSFIIFDIKQIVNKDSNRLVR